MTAENVSTLGDLSVRLHKDPEYRREYQRQKPYYDLIFEIIRQRKELNLTQKDLANMVGTHQSNISRIESGEHNVRLGTLIEIADALEAWVEIRLVPYFDADDTEYQELFTVRASSGAGDEQIASRMVSQEVAGA